MSSGHMSGAHAYHGSVGTHSGGTVSASQGTVTHAGAAAHRSGAFVASHSGALKQGHGGQGHHPGGNGGQGGNLYYGLGIASDILSLLYGIGGYGYGYGYGYNGVYPAGGYYGPALMNSGMTPGMIDPAATIVPTQSTGSAGAGTFTEKGEAAFWSGDYQGAVYDWRHAVIDDPQNPLLVMLLGQALFATGHFDEAALATHAAMQLIPKDQWGVVVSNFRELYGRPADYATQIRALEKAEADKPNDPALRFLAGFHYAFLGYPQQAIDQLDKGLKIAPTDEMAKQLREEMVARLPNANTSATPHTTRATP